MFVWMKYSLNTFVGCMILRCSFSLSSLFSLPFLWSVSSPSVLLFLYSSSSNLNSFLFSISLSSYLNLHISFLPNFLCPYSAQFHLYMSNYFSIPHLLTSILSLSLSFIFPLFCSFLTLFSPFFFTAIFAYLYIFLHFLTTDSSLSTYVYISPSLSSLIILIPPFFS